MCPTIIKFDSALMELFIWTYFKNGKSLYVEFRFVHNPPSYDVFWIWFQVTAHFFFYF